MLLPPLLGGKNALVPKFLSAIIAVYRPFTVAARQGQGECQGQRSHKKPFLWHVFLLAYRYGTYTLFIQCTRCGGRI
jgi:hypothetical protein